MNDIPLHEAGHFTWDRLAGTDHCVKAISTVPDDATGGCVEALGDHATTVDRLLARIAGCGSAETRRWLIHLHVTGLLAGAAAEMEYDGAPDDAPLPDAACFDVADARRLLAAVNGADPDAELRRLLAYTRGVLRLPSVWRGVAKLACAIPVQGTLDPAAARAIVDLYLGPLVGSLFRVGPGDPDRPHDPTPQGGAP